MQELLYTGLDSLKTAPKKLFHETGEFLANKIANKIVKPKHEKSAIKCKL